MTFYKVNNEQNFKLNWSQNFKKLFQLQFTFKALKVL